MSQIFKITKDRAQYTIQKAKVVSGNFGNQLWASVVNDAGEEGALYLPWADKDGNIGGGARQLISAGLIGPEDFTAEPDTWYDQFVGVTVAVERVFKDGKQFINVHVIGGQQALQQAAKKELDLQEIQDTQAFKKTLAATAPPVTTQRKAKEPADDRILRAFERVMEVYAPRLAEMDPELVKAICALTATHAIAYEKEG